MSPRRYSMKKRSSNAAETRQRIVESTLELHSRKGVLGTSWKDIAAHADVSIGTVYKHFPDLDALLPACGALMMERFRPPSPEDAEDLLDGLANPVDRLGRVVAEVFAFYDRAGSAAEVDPRERRLPQIQEWEVYWAGTVATFVRAALAPLRPAEAQLAFIAALLDQRSFAALRARGIAADRAATEITRMAMAWLALDQENSTR
ncbi:TetR/AcrR family transcriptional regulator [Mesorhizobium sp. 10J20-29]